MWKLVLMLFLIITSHVLTQSTEKKHNFPVGMYSVIGSRNIDGIASGFPQPGSDDFRKELLSIWQGHKSDKDNNIYEACNLVQAYGWSIHSEYFKQFIEDIRFINKAYGAGIKTQGEVSPKKIDLNRNNKLDEPEKLQLISDITSYIEYEEIWAWNLSDEPSNSKADVSLLNEIYSVIKEIDTNRIVFIVEQGLPDMDFAKYPYDLLLIDDYRYSINDWNENFTLRGLGKWISQARRDLRKSKRGETSIHAVLVLGEEKDDLDKLQEEFLVNHSLNHAAIRHVLDLGVTGIWFYAWRVGPGVLVDDDAVNRWLIKENYAEAIETELHDIDKLNQVFDDNSLIISSFSDNKLVNEKVFNFDSSISSIVSGDFHGNKDYNNGITLLDKSFYHSEGFLCNSDGDDELVLSMNNNSLLFNEVGNNFGNFISVFNNSGKITHLAAGDVDGDADDELVFSTKSNQLNKIFICDIYDGKVYNIKEIYSSEYYEISALTLGDFDELGYDKLVTAFSNKTDKDTRIYIADLAKEETASAKKIFGPYPVIITSFTNGDYFKDNFFYDYLVTSTINFDSTNAKIYLDDIRNSKEPLKKIIYSDSTNYWNITAMCSGDFVDDSIKNEEIIIGFYNNQKNHTIISKVHPQGIYSKSNLPNDGVNYIYNEIGKKRGKVISLTAGSFRESMNLNYEVK